jgi:Trypsin
MRRYRMIHLAWHLLQVHPRAPEHQIPMTPAFRIALAVVSFLVAVPATPIIMRHDRDEQRYLDLGRNYLATVSVRPADATKGLGGEGTLVSPRWVLTAAHVASELGPDDLAEVAGEILRIDRVVLHPEWHQVVDVKRDIALIHLKSTAKHVRPARLYTATNEVGKLVTFVGRGGTGTGVTGPTGAEDRRVRAATNRVERADGPFLQFRFDGSCRAPCYRLGGH